MRDTSTMTFWDHLDELRGVIVRVLVVTVIGASVAFCLKDELFAIVLAPRSSDFITYQLLGVEPFCVHLMNIGLTEQFMVHLKTAFYAGVLVASPYIIYQLFRFVSPALYDNERKYATLLCLSGYLMFMLGTALNYLLIFPLTVKFLGTYQVSPNVANMLTLQSYMDTLLMMNLVMGIVFELPVVSWLLGKMGLINAAIMQSIRRHAVVAILVVAAIITPTTDAFTLMVVALPIWLLYELSIVIVRITE
jgi:sec-independent protein translocase protein TatC